MPRRRDRPSGDAPPLEARELGRNVGRARDGEHGLTESGASKELEDARRAPDIQLGEWVVEQQQWLRVVALAQRRRFEHAKRDRRRALLPARAEEPKLSAVERQ